MVGWFPNKHVVSFWQRVKSLAVTGSWRFSSCPPVPVAAILWTRSIQKALSSCRLCCCVTHSRLSPWKPHQQTARWMASTDIYGIALLSDFSMHGATWDIEQILKHAVNLIWVQQSDWSCSPQQEFVLLFISQIICVVLFSKKKMFSPALLWFMNAVPPPALHLRFQTLTFNIAGNIQKVLVNYSNAARLQQRWRTFHKTKLLFISVKIYNPVSAEWIKIWCISLSPAPLAPVLWAEECRKKRARKPTLRWECSDSSHVWHSLPVLIRPSVTCEPTKAKIARADNKDKCNNSSRKVGIRDNEWSVAENIYTALYLGGF